MWWWYIWYTPLISRGFWWSKKLCWTLGLALAEICFALAKRVVKCHDVHPVMTWGQTGEMKVRTSTEMTDSYQARRCVETNTKTLRYPLGIKRGNFFGFRESNGGFRDFYETESSAASWADLWHRPAGRWKVMKVMRVCPVTKKVWNGRITSRISRRSFRSKIRLSWTMKREAMWTFGKEITRDSERNWTEHAAATTYVWAAFDLKQKSINVYNFSLSLTIYIYIISISIYNSMTFFLMLC